MLEIRSFPVSGGRNILCLPEPPENAPPDAPKTLILQHFRGFSGFAKPSLLSYNMSYFEPSRSGLEKYQKQSLQRRPRNGERKATGERF
jgi:hypothetical protein